MEATSLPELNPRQQEAMAHIRDAPYGSYSIIGYGGAVGGGKGSVMSSTVYTPFGPTEMRNIKVGSAVSNPDGTTAKVVAIYPLGIRQIYKVTFSDGSSTRVTDDHLWLIKMASKRLKADRKYIWAGEASDRFSNGRMWTTAELKKYLDEVRPNLKGNSAHWPMVPLTEPVVFTRTYKGDMRPIDPYALGLLLGDGSMRGKKSLTFATRDPELLEELRNRTGVDFCQQADTADHYSRGPNKNPFIANLAKIGVWDHLAHEKFIPDSYKYHTVEARFEILRGLMDTDGYADSRGHAHYYSVSKQLADDVKWIVQSLGGRATITEKQGSYRKDDGTLVECQVCYCVYIQMPDNREIFGLARKKDRCKKGYNGGHEAYRRMVSIEEDGEEEAQCISVDHPNQLYLVDDFIVTHNTYFDVRAALTVAISFPGSRILVGRQEFNKLKTTTMEEFDRIVPREMIVKRHDTDNWRDLRLAHWPEGVASRVYFRGLENWPAIGSEQYNAVIIDEAGETSRNAANWLLTRLRHPLPKKVQAAFKQRDPNWKMRYYFIASSNPWPGWFTDWFFHRQLDDVFEAIPGCKVHFVRAKISDNQENLPENYEALAGAGLAPDQRERFIQGRFDTFSEQVYGDVFKPDEHRWLRPPPTHEDYTRVVGGLDFGGARPDAHFSTGIVGVITNSNRLIRVAEFKDRGPGVLDRQIAWMLGQQSRWCQPGKRIQWVADRTQGIGIQLMQRQGFFVTASSGAEIEQGINAVARRLMPDGIGIPGSFYLPELKEWESEMQQYRWDTARNDNTPAKRHPIKVGDDLADADRYMHEIIERHAVDPMTIQNPLAVVGG